MPSLTEPRTRCLTILVAIAALSLAGASSTKRDYKGYAVIRGTPRTETQLKHLQEFKESFPTTDHRHLEFWTEPLAVNSSVDILASPENLVMIEDNLRKWNIASERIIKDVGLKIKHMATFDVNRDHVADNGTLSNRLATSRFYTDFHRYSVIEAKLHELEQLDPRVTLEVIGKSSEGRNLYLVKVSNDASAKKPIVLIDGGHHAREWISHATVMYFIESLVNIDVPRMPSHLCENDACRRELFGNRARLNLNKYDYWFIPVVNPDGYEYSHETDRLWRKTRSGSYCRGVDPNRNYPFHWNEAGSSQYMCSEIYSGRRAMSEPELLLAPYGYARVYPENYAELARVGNTFIESMGRLRKTNYQFGTSAITLYPSSGGSDDYAHSLGIPLAYTLELPDRGKNGFITPTSEIIPIAYETLVGVQSMIEAS